MPWQHSADRRGLPPTATGLAATLGGVCQGGSVVGLLGVGNMIYKPMGKASKVSLVSLLLVLCTVVPFGLARRRDANLRAPLALAALF